MGPGKGQTTEAPKSDKNASDAGGEQKCPGCPHLGISVEDLSEMIKRALSVSSSL